MNLCEHALHFEAGQSSIQSTHVTCLVAPWNERVGATVPRGVVKEVLLDLVEIEWLENLDTFSLFQTLR